MKQRSIVQQGENGKAQLAGLPDEVKTKNDKKKGKQNKTVTLVTNAIPNTKVLTINGNVIVPQKK